MTVTSFCCSDLLDAIQAYGGLKGIFTSSISVWLMNHTRGGIKALQRVVKPTERFDTKLTNYSGIKTHHLRHNNVFPDTARLTAKETVEREEMSSPPL